MPVAVSYPGVYLEEISSGVHTIVGVSTSVTAFVGAARTGPISQPRHIFSFPDYERLYGGLDQLSEMSYAVRQFFLNGGSEAWIVRASPGAAPAKLSLSAGVNVLDLQAVAEGFAGNSVTVSVDYDTPVPGSTFTLSVAYPSPDNPQNAQFESFANVSMNPADARYVLTVVNGVSKLVQLQLTDPQLVPPPPLATTAQSTGGLLRDDDVKTIVTSTPPRTTLRVSLNGDPPVTVTLQPTDITIASVQTAIQNQVKQAGANHPYTDFSCIAVADDRPNPPGGLFRLQCTIGAAAAADSIRILPGLVNDASAALKLGSVNGWAETDPFETRRPQRILSSGTVFGGELSDHDAIPAGGTFQIKLDDDTTARVVTIGNHTGLLPDFRAMLGAIAQDIQLQVRGQAVTPALQAAYQNFSASVMRNNALRLVSGSSGASSSIVVTPSAANDMAAPLRLVGPSALWFTGHVAALAGGAESAPPWESTATIEAYLGRTSSQAVGIYALGTIDFNLLVLAGVYDPAITAAAAAYCYARRAFYIADPPPGKSPDDMSTYMMGTSVPKSDYGAIYYPYVQIPDPLTGALRTCPPSGTIAGIHARTDGTRGVWKAAAGTTDGILTNVVGLATVMSDGQNGSLNPLGLNALRLFPVYGALSWGARTFRGADAANAEYKYIPVRRLALFMEESLYRGTQWVVFEPNDEPLWAQIRLNVGAFMQDLFRKGAFQGQTPRQAYFVRCDSTTTTQNDINLGIVNIVVGFAPLKPAEFVVIQIQQIAGQIGT